MSILDKEIELQHKLLVKCVELSETFVAFYNSFRNEETGLIEGVTNEQVKEYIKKIYEYRDEELEEKNKLITLYKEKYPSKALIAIKAEVRCLCEDTRVKVLDDLMKRD
jgi:hypothetical protein